MPFTRVKDKKTGHEFSVLHVNPDKHEVLKDKDAEDRFGRPLPAKHNVTKGGQPASAKEATK